MRSHNNKGIGQKTQGLHKSCTNNSSISDLCECDNLEPWGEQFSASCTGIYLDALRPQVGTYKNVIIWLQFLSLFSVAKKIKSYISLCWSESTFPRIPVSDPFFLLLRSSQNSLPIIGKTVTRTKHSDSSEQNKCDWGYQASLCCVPWNL